MKKAIVFLFALSAVALTSSCNTFIGLTRDIQQVGQGFENKAHGRAWNPDEASANQPTAPQAPAAPQQ